MKTHLFRSTRSTWCGRPILDHSSGRTLAVTRDRRSATCLTCLKADAAEQRKQDAASQ